MASNKTLQKIKAGRNVAGENVFDGCDVNIHLPKLSRIALLLKRLEAGDHGPAVDGYHPDLAAWMKPAGGSTVLGVEKKLSAAGRQDLVAQAEEYKERIYAQLVEMQYSNTFQRICVELMGEVLQRFDAYVKPAILAGKSREEIDKLVHEMVVAAVYDRIDKCGVESSISWNAIRGMLYFLTGNCHIKWIP